MKGLCKYNSKMGAVPVKNTMDDEYEFDVGHDIDVEDYYSATDIVVENPETIKLDKITKEMNTLLQSAETNQVIRANFVSFCDENQEIIDSSFFLGEIKRLINEKIDAAEAKLFANKEDRKVETIDDYEEKLRAYEKLLQEYDRECVKKNKDKIMVLKQKLDESEKLLFTEWDDNLGNDDLSFDY